MMFNSQISQVTSSNCLHLFTKWHSNLASWSLPKYLIALDVQDPGTWGGSSFFQAAANVGLEGKTRLKYEPLREFADQVGLYSQLGLCIMPCLVNLESPMAFSWDKVTWSCAKADSMSVAKVQRSCIHQQDTCSQELGKSTAYSSPRKGDVHTSPKWDLIKASIRFY